MALAYGYSILYSDAPSMIRCPKERTISYGFIYACYYYCIYSLFQLLQSEMKDLCFGLGWVGSNNDNLVISVYKGLALAGSSSYLCAYFDLDEEDTKAHRVLWVVQDFSIMICGTHRSRFLSFRENTQSEQKCVCKSARQI